MLEQLELSKEDAEKVCRIATNRDFTRKEWMECGLPLHLFYNMLEGGLIERQSSPVKYHPTKKGWEVIETTISR